VAAVPASIPPAAAAPVVAPAAVTPLVATPAASRPPASAPISTPVAAVPNPPAARRPGVNGSLPPGSLSAERPSVVQQPSTTRADLLKEVNKLSREEFRRKLRDANFVKRLEAAGIPVLGQRN
jgi:hypothetical protein